MNAVPYLYAEPHKPRLLRLADTRVGLVAPSRITASGVAVARVGTSERAVTFRLDVRLVVDEQRYFVREQALTEITADELKDQMPELVADGVGATFDVDADIAAGVRWNLIRRGAVEGVPMPVSLGGRETHMLDEELTGEELVGLCWLLARLTFGDANVLISDALGCTREAAAQRLVRVRRAGIVPPAERAGQRKVRP